MSNCAIKVCRNYRKYLKTARNVLSMTCEDKSEQHRIVDRPKKMAISLENALKRIKESTQDFSKNFRVRFNTDPKAFTDEDFRHYEKLVIMKKNPYIDLKDIELKFSPTDKTIRQSLKIDSGYSPQTIAGEPSFWEPMEEGPNVEIINRGLTGFAIPAKISSPKLISKIKSDSIKKAEEILGTEVNSNSDQSIQDY